MRELSLSHIKITNRTQHKQVLKALSYHDCAELIFLVQPESTPPLPQRSRSLESYRERQRECPSTKPWCFNTITYTVVAETSPAVHISQHDPGGPGFRSQAFHSTLDRQRKEPSKNHRLLMGYCWDLINQGNTYSYFLPTKTSKNPTLTKHIISKSVEFLKLYQSILSYSKQWYVSPRADR